VERIATSELAAYVGQRVRLAGWVHRIRRLSNVTFVILRDSRGMVQIVVEEPSARQALATLEHEYVIEIEGMAVAVAQAPNGVEVHRPVIELTAAAAAPLPVDLFRPTLAARLPTLLDHAALTLRHPRRQATFRLAAASMAGFRQALQAQSFVEIQTPKIVAGATESGANVFAIDYFGRPAYLAQSPQLYKQIMVGVFERVFEVGPVFRAEPHDTPRHLNEYVSMDAEMGFIRDHTTVMAMLTQALRGMAAAVEAEQAALRHLGVSVPTIPATIPTIHFTDAQATIARETDEDPRGEPDLSPAHERFLGEWARREYGSEFLFVVGYPMVKRPFYTHPDLEHPTYSNSFDLLFRGMELVTGGQRLHRHADYLAALADRGLDLGGLEGYLEAFAYGMPPHGGFAIGLERWVARIVGAANLRETALFPRDMQRLTP
jgi:nondiscriminating aspartyl-tRNA synthetase